MYCCYHLFTYLQIINNYNYAYYSSRAYNRTREGNFALQGLLGFDIHGKTVGIVGTGKIGVYALVVCVVCRALCVMCVVCRALCVMSLTRARLWTCAGA
jgi:hypothetical protein